MIDIKTNNNICYNLLKEKAEEMLRLLESMSCDDCNSCPLYDGGCTKQDKIQVLEYDYKIN